MTDVRCVAQTADVLGEVPVWHAAEQALYWIDCFKPALHRFEPASGRTSSWTPPVKLGSFAPRAAGGFLLASRAGFGLYDPASGGFAPFLDPEPDMPDNLLNDGRCDRRGRFWVGSMNKLGTAATGRLYRLDADRGCQAMADSIWVSNSLAFAPDDRTLYFGDSHHRTIWAWDLDIASGAIAGRRVFAVTEGIPDGSCADEAGGLWNAEFDSGRVVRYRPDGSLDRAIALPVSRPTACALGGDDLRTLFVTTATFRLPPERRAAEPDAGGLLAVRVDVPGVQEPLYGG